jgi:uncharacterized protein (TIGR02099 family)
MEPTIAIPSTPPALPSRRLRWIAQTMRWLLWLLASAWILFALSWFVLHGWIVPRIGDYRPQLEAVASQALGVPVRIGQLSAHSEGMIPSVELRDVTLLDSQGRAALRLPSVMGLLSPSSLWGLGFEQLTIDQPELDIRRTADGKIYVGGLDMSQNLNSGSTAVADWFFSQSRLVIRSGTVRWTDDMRPAPPLALTQVDWSMRNTLRRHEMRLDATPPAEWGERLSLRGMFRQSLLSRDAGDFAAWNGQLYAEASRLDVSRLRQYVGADTLGVELIRGHGALRAWADVSKGRITGATTDVALRDVDAKLGPQLESLAFESMAGRVTGARRTNGFDLSTQGLGFRIRDGLQWPGGNVTLAYTDTQAGRPQHGEIKADKLDLAALAQITSRLPLSSASHALISSFAPQGLVQSLDARWQGSLAAPVNFSAKGRVAGLSLAAAPAVATSAPRAATASAVPAEPGRPGISGAEVDFDITQDGGSARIGIVKGALDLPGVFEESRVPFDQLQAQAQWKLSGRKIELQLRDLQFANADAQGQAQVSWRTEDAAPSTPAAGAPDRRFPGVLDLQGSLSRGEGTRVHRYLPLVLPDEARHYVRDAVQQGQVSDVKFKVKGAVRQLPFTNPAQGEFRVSAQVRNGQLGYVPKALQPAGAAPWPALTELKGELVFNRAALEVNGVSGKVAGLQLLKGEAKIADLMHNATVEVKIDLNGPLAGALAFVNGSPVGGMTNQVLAKAVASGSADYRFKLSLPIHTIDKSRVEGSIVLPGNDVQFVPGTPQLAQLKGQITITERGFSVSGAQARLLGGELRFDGGTRSAPTPAAGVPGSELNVAFNAQGTLTAEGLREAKDLGLLARLGQHASGAAAYAGTLGFRRGVAEVTLASSLKGLALNLPAPLNKTAEAELPLRVEKLLLPGAQNAEQPLHDELSVNIGRVVAINYVRDLNGVEPIVLRGGLAVGLEPGESVALPAAGVAANIKLTQVDLDAWEKIFDSAAAGNAPPVAAAGSAGAAALSYLPTLMAIRAKELVVQGRRLNNVVVGGSREGLNWRANIDASELNGYLEFAQPGRGSAGRVYARLARLNLAAGQASDVEAILDEQPASIPSLDIVVEDMELRGKKLGRVEIDAVNRDGTGAGGVREWRLRKFNVTMPEAVLTATGNWVAAKTPAAGGTARSAPARSERRRTEMNFKLDISDSGELLKRFGMDGVIRRGKGKLEGQIDWLGSPLSPDYPSMGGQFNVNVESGQFVKADPGIAKLLGVLSLQSLPRRLTLDFRDVFSQGFAFDFVRGDVSIAQGRASTNNLQMSGVNAAVLMEGSADIDRETQDIKVVVVPEINAGTASLIATAINPALGVGTFLAQMFLRRPLMEAATQEFHIDGTWDDPKIVKIDRKARAAAAAAAKTADRPTENKTP